jgi:DNA polymerase III alpha subunit
MHQFVRCLLYVTHRFKEDGVLWGVGRGSSCASLIMYLLGINKVDPVKYNIPAEEFFK